MCVRVHVYMRDVIRVCARARPLLTCTTPRADAAAASRSVAPVAAITPVAMKTVRRGGRRGSSRDSAAVAAHGAVT